MGTKPPGCGNPRTPQLVVLMTTLWFVVHSLRQRLGGGCINVFDTVWWMPHSRGGGSTPSPGPCHSLFGTPGAPGTLPSPGRLHQLFAPTPSSPLARRFPMAGTGGDSAPPFEGAEPRDAAAGWLAGGEWRGTEERRRLRAPVRCAPYGGPFVLNTPPGQGGPERTGNFCLFIFLRTALAFGPKG